MAYDNSASIRLARVYEKTSKSGNTYMVGRIGGAKVAILKSRDVAEDGGAIWDILLSPASISGNDYRQSMPAKNDASVIPTDSDHAQEEITGENSFGLLNERASRSDELDDMIPF